MSAGGSRAASWGAGGKVRVAAISAGAVFILLIAAFVIYSFTLKNWCEAQQEGWSGGKWGRTGLGGEVGQCIRDKSIFSF